MGWKAEGIGWYAPLIGQAVYRLYNPNTGDHHYTSSKGESVYLIKVGWNDEGIGWYSGGNRAVYRLYNPNAKGAGSHHYTLSKSEYDHLDKIGWNAENIAWHSLDVSAVESAQKQSNSKQSWQYSIENQNWNLLDKSGKVIKTVATISATSQVKPANAFLATIQEGAIAGYKNGILPSITAAQAILESGWGKSKLAQNPNNNLFGIKASADWQGETVVIATKEFVDNEMISVDAAFRKYKSWTESLIDHSLFFVSTDFRKNRYQKFIGDTNYRTAAQSLYQAGYATDPNYASKLIKLIEDYKLYEWDKTI